MRISRRQAGMVVAVVLLAGVVLFALRPRGGGSDEVLVLCGGSMRAALETIISKYRAKSSDRILATYGGSGELWRPWSIWWPPWDFPTRSFVPASESRA